MSEELAYFNEDAQDQLQMMEGALLDAAEQGPNEEYIGTIFRAMHTIKGTAGMFGFEEIIGFTHIAEHLMDAVRNGRITLDENLLMLLLQCKDHVEALVGCAVESITPSTALLDIDRELKATIESYLQSPEPPADRSEQADPLESSSAKLWHISLRLKEHFFETGMDLLSIIAFFRQMGELRTVAPVLEKLPPLESIEPLMPYMGFEIAFEGEVTQEAIEEVFEFVEDDVLLQIFLADDTQGWERLFGEEPELVPLIESDVRFGYGGAAVPEAEAPLPQQEKEPELSISQEKRAESGSGSEPKKQTSQSLRVDSTKIDILIDTISEMVIANAKVARYVEEHDDGELEEVSLQFDTLLEELRNNVMDIRMVPVGDSFAKFRRVVNDVARKLDKKIDFVIHGGETELDKTVIEKIADPLLHMLRNAIDHGIETPEQRRQANKAETGSVELRAYPESGSIVIEIEDDGKGLSAESIIAKARAKGLIGEMEELSDAEAYQLIFEPGFSTAEVVSDISGRGVGMDVVRKNIEALKGEVELFSTPGKGSCFVIRLPLTLAIIDGFLLQVGQTHYIIPLDMVAEVMEYSVEQRVDLPQSDLFDLRGTLLPLLDVRRFFDEEPCEMCERENIIVVKYGRQKMGLLVDELYGEYQTVIKPLGMLFKNAPGLYGASILGSGEIALIFDIPALFETLTKNQSLKEYA